MSGLSTSTCSSVGSWSTSQPECGMFYIINYCSLYIGGINTYELNTQNIVHCNIDDINKNEFNTHIKKKCLITDKMLV